MTIDEIKNALDIKKYLGLEQVIDSPVKNGEFIVRHNWGEEMYAITNKKSFDSETYWYTLEELGPVLEVKEWFAKMIS